MTKAPKTSYLVAEPQGFPGVRIPLVSEEERIALGLPAPVWPPMEQWSEIQRKAAGELAEILLPIAIYEAAALMADAVGTLAPEEIQDDFEGERAAARKAIEMLQSKKWKNKWTNPHLPRSWIQQVLEYVVSGEVSIFGLKPEGGNTSKKKRAKTKGQRK